MELAKAKKISVVGNSGAGKSTLSETLGKSTGLEVFTVDKIYWLPGWHIIDKASFVRIHRQWLEQESWIIEGVGYWDEMERRIIASDIVLFLDVPVSICLERARNRLLEERISPNPYITEGCIYGEAKDMQIEVIEHFHKKLRPTLMHFLSGINEERVRVISEISDIAMQI